jgi:Armadillo/beta-catenin-like repeat
VCGEERKSPYAYLSTCVVYTRVVHFCTCVYSARFPCDSCLIYVCVSPPPFPPISPPLRRLLSSSTCFPFLPAHCSDSPSLRDQCLSQGALDKICSVIESEPKTTVLRNATWALSNLCRGKPQPAFSTVSVALPTLERLIRCKDVEVTTDALWALSYLSDGPNPK